MASKINFLGGEDTKFPPQLLVGREVIEGNLIGMLWKYPNLLDIYEELEEKSFRTEDGRFYFRIISLMRNAGYNIMDEISVASFMIANPEFKPLFDMKGGFRAINSLATLMNEINMPKYFDDLIKHELLLSLHLLGFGVVQHLQALNKLDSNGVYDFYDGALNSIFVKKQLDLETADLSQGYGDFLVRANSGQNMGLSYAKASPIMNYQTSGVRRGCTIVGATTSGGKSSWLAHHYILNFIEQGQKVMLIINEEEEDSWRSLILTTVINTRICHWDDEKGEYNHKGMSRKRFLEGNFTDEEWYLIGEAQKWLEQFPKSIEYIKCFDYKIDTIKKIVGKYSKEGYTVAILDTFKAPDGGNDNNPAWKQMVEASKALFQATAKAKMYLIVTAQVALRYNAVRKLDCSHLGGATAISEIADTVVIFRDVWADELDLKSGKFIDPFRYHKDVNGKYTSTKVKLNLDNTKKYAVAFLAKVRAGEKGTEILYRKDIAFNVFKELGYCSVAQF